MASDRKSNSAVSRAGKWLQVTPEGVSLRDGLLKSLRESRRPPEGQSDLQGINLAGEDLAGVNFSQCDLSGSNLSECNLEGANFSWARLRGASLFKARLLECEFLNADLVSADLTECQAQRAGFGRADLTDAVLLGGDLRSATFGNALLKHTDFRASNLQEARLREADLTHANFATADLRQADFQSSLTTKADFSDADLRGAHLKGIKGFMDANWLGTDIRSVDFCGAYMVRRFIMDENYLYEFRTQNRFSGILYSIWWITSDCGRSFLRWGLWTAAVAFLFALLFSFLEVDYGDHPTTFSPLYYSFVTLTTLGYGDVVPASSAAQIVSVIEVVVGYVALGGLLSIFATKMARRAE
jgi:uncharacterized protein YjbI with pentapeptide repeats